jgi:hypothetical protein
MPGSYPEGERGGKKGAGVVLMGKGCSCGFLTELEEGKGEDWESLGELEDVKLFLKKYRPPLKP